MNGRGEVKRAETSQELVERGLAAAGGRDCAVLVDEHSSVNLRWAMNGLTTNGLNTVSFSAWFNGTSIASASTVMSYVVRCAWPEGTALTWTNPLTFRTFTWHGSLGLAPGWASGQPITRAESELISACLAAHVNAYGANVEISILGRTAAGDALPVAAGELSTWSTPEGCFFGNLATGEGMFAGSDRVSPASESSVRACALSTQQPGMPGTCSPMVYVGRCSEYCTLDASGTFYERCSYNGRSYRPLTTRVKPQDVYTCGDGVCQSTERPGTGNVPSSCAADCGTSLL